MLEDKKTVREKLLALRDNYNGKWLQEQNLAICARLLAWPFLTKAKGIMGYLAFGKEVNIDGVLKNALNQGKRVFIPYLPPGADKVMLAAELKSFADLSLGRYGIRTLPKAKVFAEPSEIDFILTPGLAFTEGGDRLGLGAGYYDRFLPRFPNVILAGVTLSTQILSELPVAEHDINMDFLVSEKSIINCKMSSSVKNGG